MATLTYKVRLGISKGWRVRSLNQVKFYVQTVAHCLFIFTSLRLRGYRDKIWTLNYTVFLTRSKYLIFVEFLVLPNSKRWIRGITKSMCYGFIPHTDIQKPQKSVLAKFVPKLLLARKIRRGFKKTRAVPSEGSVWAWSYKVELIKTLLRIKSKDSKPSLSQAIHKTRCGLLQKPTFIVGRNPIMFLARFKRSLHTTPVHRFSLLFTRYCLPTQLDTFGTASRSDGFRMNFQEEVGDMFGKLRKTNPHFLSKWIRQYPLLLRPKKSYIRKWKGGRRKTRIFRSKR